VSRSDIERLGDVLAALDRCLTFRTHLDADDVVLADMALDAILRNLAVAGEAAKALSQEMRAEFAATSWHSIAGLRNIVIHEYFRIDTAIIVDVVDNHAAPLADAIRRRLTAITEVAGDE